jgi:hypothetical protein
MYAVPQVQGVYAGGAPLYPGQSSDLRALSQLRVLD